MRQFVSENCLIETLELSDQQNILYLLLSFQILHDDQM